MSNSYNNGRNDAAQNKGMQSPQSHQSYQAREKYEAGYKHQQQAQQNKSK